MAEVDWTDEGVTIQAGYQPEQPSIPGYRIGDRVRCTKGDRFIDAGTTGIITNVNAPLYRRPGRARILWDHECSSMVDTTDIEVISRRTGAA